MDDCSISAEVLQQQQSGRRPKGRQRARQLFCPAHPEQRISGDGRRYLLHLLTSEELRQRGMGDKRARLVIQSYPVLVLHNEWLEELHCPTCGLSHWCHVVRREDSSFVVRWAPRELWEQVAHVDPLVPTRAWANSPAARPVRVDGAGMGDGCSIRASRVANNAAEQAGNSSTLTPRCPLQ
jgi:hypothetical protein